MVTYQWGIFWTDLNPVKGSEQAGVRPVLVISSEEANQALPVLTVISITSLKQGRKIYLTEALLNGNDSGLVKDSIVMAHQIRTISKERIRGKAGEIVKEEVKGKIRDIIRLYLDL